MFKEIVNILQGAFLWKTMCIRFRINYKKVVLILVNENKKLDYYAAAHLEDYMQRKYADEALILFDNDSVYKMIRRMKTDVCRKLYRYPEKKIRKLYQYFSFYKFFDNIVFTYTSCPKDNQLGRVLKETQINEEEAVCLGLYRLRTVPVLEGRNQGDGHV